MEVLTNGLNLTMMVSLIKFFGVIISILLSAAISIFGIMGRIIWNDLRKIIEELRDSLGKHSEENREDLKSIMLSHAESCRRCKEDHREEHKRIWEAIEKR